MGETDLKNRICYICGEPNADSDDHVPPKNIFLPEKRNQGEDLIKVPAHIKCNQMYSMDDEYFRIFVNVPGFWNNKDAQELWKSKIYSSLQRPEAKKFKRSILSALKPVDLFTKAGIFLGKSAKINIDSERVERVIERTSRGIFYKETECVLPLDTVFEIILIKPEESNIFGRSNHLSPIKNFANNSFIYRWSRAIDNNNSGIFWFIFYESVEFVVLFFDKYEWEKKSA